MIDFPNLIRCLEVKNLGKLFLIKKTLLSGTEMAFCLETAFPVAFPYSDEKFYLSGNPKSLSSS
jgi:hypothetical protein